MRSYHRVWPRVLVIVTFTAVLALVLSANAEARKRFRTRAEYNPEHENVAFFAGADAGRIQVKVIPKDAFSATILIENMTDQPLNVELPAEFGLVPAGVLAQCDCAPGCGEGGGAQSGGGGAGGVDGGGGFFNVPPDQIARIEVATICLSHGRADPRPTIPYALKPIDEVSNVPGVAELCRLVGEKKIAQRVAQAAAWHLANEMSWEELAAKEIRRANGDRYPYFSRKEIRGAMRVAGAVVEMANDPQKSLKDGLEGSPGELASSDGHERRGKLVRSGNAP